MGSQIDDLVANAAGGPRPVATLLPDPEPAEIWCPVISVDDHVLEPLDLFDRFGSARYVDELPSASVDDDGVPWWHIGEMTMPVILANGAAGRPRAEWRPAIPQRHDEFRTGVWDVDARLLDMDLNGIWASLCFPSVTWGFAGSAFLRLGDRAVGREAARAYNRWMLEEWCGSHRDRMIPCQIPWLGDPTEAADEVRDNAELGFRSVSFSENPAGLGLPGLYTGAWDPFFAACEETETVVSLHVGSSGMVQSPSEGSPNEVIAALFPVNSILAAVDWIYAKIPNRFPNLRIVLSEGGASWVPMAQERLRRAYRIRDSADSTWEDVDGDPVDVLARNFWFASLEDPAAFRMLEQIGEDRVMVESDYPHADSTWPTTQALLRAQTEGVISDAVIRKVAYGTAAALFRHPQPPPEVLAQSIVGSRQPA